MHSPPLLPATLVNADPTFPRLQYEGVSRMQTSLRRRHRDRVVRRGIGMVSWLSSTRRARPAVAHAFPPRAADDRVGLLLDPGRPRALPQPAPVDPLCACVSSRAGSPTRVRTSSHAPFSLPLADCVQEVGFRPRVCAAPRPRSRPALPRADLQFRRFVLLPYVHELRLPLRHAEGVSFFRDSRRNSPPQPIGHAL